LLNLLNVVAQQRVHRAVPLIAASDYENSFVFRDAVRALKMLGDHAAVEALVEWYAKYEADRQRTIVAALLELGASALIYVEHLYVNAINSTAHPPFLPSAVLELLEKLWEPRRAALGNHIVMI
jgi:HEAT repeat protein